MIYHAKYTVCKVHLFLKYTYTKYEDEEKKEDDQMLMTYSQEDHRYLDTLLLNQLFIIYIIGYR